MKATFFLVTTLIATSCSLAADSSAPSQAGSQRIAFTRNSMILVANIDGTQISKVTSGADPAIAPDGTRLAFTYEPPGIKTLERYIALMDLASGARKIFREVPSKNSFGPVWSPDGARLLFEIFVENHWRTGLIQGDGTNFRFVNLPEKDTGWFSLTWSPDGESIYCQDLEKICRFSLDGALLASWEVNQIFPKTDLDSSDRLSISPDGKKLLIDVGMDEETAKDFEGPGPAIWIFEFDSGKVRRLTPKGSYATEPAWINNSDYLFVDQEKKNLSSLYRTSIFGETRKIILSNGADPSVSNR